jgi:hypothetical protein
MTYPSILTICVASTAILEIAEPICGSDLDQISLDPVGTDPIDPDQFHPQASIQGNGLSRTKVSCPPQDVIWQSRTIISRC